MQIELRSNQIFSFITLYCISFNFQRETTKGVKRRCQLFLIPLGRMQSKQKVTNFQFAKADLPQIADSTS